MIKAKEWREIKQHVFQAFKSGGVVDKGELAEIIEFGCAEGDFDDDEKPILINIISGLTRADVSDEMWAKIDKLIHKVELIQDCEASIEHLEETEDL